MLVDKTKDSVMPSRREFILNCSAFAATAALAPATALAVRPRLRDVGLESVSAELFAAHLNTWFVARDNQGGGMAVQLAAVETPDAGSGELGTAGGDFFERFSLVFAGDVSQPLGQNTYTFEHASIGRFAMFIVPVGRPDPKRCFYEAVFSRPLAEASEPKRGQAIGKIR
jgi:hypothetical protein